LQQLAGFNDFLDQHPELAERLRQDPSLVNNPDFVADHPVLQQYMQQHPEVREELQENPNAFMRQEARYDRREDRRLAATADPFFDSHPEIAEQLRKDPSLINDPRFVQQHPALQQFLAQHPEVQQEFRDNPNAFMHQEERYERGEDRRMAATADQFLDSHPEIAEQLRKNPSLVNDSRFVQQHPALQQFLAQHPELSQEFRENPNAFMQQEERYDRGEDRRMAANADRFFDSHPEIAEQLRKNPALVNDPRFVQQHPSLQQYLDQHSEIRQEFQANPAAFMQQQQSFEQRESARGISGTNAVQADFAQFLGDHSSIAQEISRNPQLLQDDEYLKNHPALQQYLRAHPQAKQEFAQNPGAFMSSLPQGTSSPLKNPSGNAKAKQQ
jgi:hypothetical protein